MTVSPSAHKLRLNSLLLSTGPDAEGTGDPDGRWWWGVYGSDFSTGAAEPIEVTMRTLLQDGARVVTQGYGNREVTFFAVVGGVDSRALATAEKELALNLGRRGELGWTPADGWAPETVFDIETSSMVAGGPEDDDLIEVMRNERVYRLRFVCQPFVRSAALSVVPALPPPPSAILDEDILDAGTSVTRWTARIGALSDGGSYLRVGGTKTPRAKFTPVAPIDISTQPYITLVTTTGGPPSCDVNGVRATVIGSETATLGSNAFATRWYWLTSQTVINNIEWGVDFPDTLFSFLFTNLRVRNLPAYTGSLRQSVRSIEVDGSARTQGALQIVAPEGEVLGSVIFYSTTRPVGGVPSLREWRVSGGTLTADAGAVSGFSEPMTALVFDVPVQVLSRGKNQILGRFRKEFLGSASPTATWTAQTMIGGSNVGPAATGSVTLGLGDSYRIVALATADLPPTDLPEGADAVIRITIAADAVYDQMWVLNLDDGAVSVVEAGGRSRAWIETATTDRPRPAIYIGNNADQSDAFHDPSLVRAWGVHEFAPPLTTALVVTASCESPDVSFEFFRRYMNFVAPSS